jgi:hypothetical protein
MKRKAYLSEPLPISWTYKDYIQGKREFIHIMRKTDRPISLASALTMARSDDPKFKLPYGKSMIDYIPSSKLTLPVDSASVVANKAVSAEYNPLILKEMLFDLEGKDAIGKVDAITLDLINQNKWERPVYYAITVPKSIWACFDPYMQKTGLAYQIVPLNLSDQKSRTNLKKMYDNVMNKFKWGGLEKPGLYVDETIMRMCKSQRSVIFAELASALIDDNKPDSALRVLDRCVEVFPEENVPYESSIIPIVNLYLRLGQIDKAKAIGAKVFDNLLGEIDWLLRLKPSLQATVVKDLSDDLDWTRYLLSAFMQTDKPFADQYADRWTQYYNNSRTVLQNAN